MYVRVWYDMGKKHSDWIYITHYEFRKVFGFEEPKELIIRRSSGLEGLDYNRLPARIDDTWARLRRFVNIGNEYAIVPHKILCVFKQSCI